MEGRAGTWVRARPCNSSATVTSSTRASLSSSIKWAKHFLLEQVTALVKRAGCVRCLGELVFYGCHPRPRTGLARQASGLLSLDGG